MRTALKLSDKRERYAVDDATMQRQWMAAVACEQSRTAFAELFSVYAPRVKAVMIKSGADHALAEDIMQDVMMSVWRKAGLYYPERGTVATWIFTIARNARIDRLRRQSSRPYTDVDEIEIASQDRNAEEETLANQHASRINTALEKLPENQRIIIDLSYIQGVSQNDIALQLDLPLGTVKSRMRLAYAKLRADLEDLK